MSASAKKYDGPKQNYLGTLLFLAKLLTIGKVFSTVI